MSGFNLVKIIDPTAIVTGGLVPKGAYAGGTTYAVGDSVSYNSQSYVAIGATTGNLPTNTTYWQLLAAQGATGATGSTGATGANGLVTSVVAGTGISVNSGTPSAPSVAIDTSVTVDKTTAQVLTNKDLTSGTNTFPTFNQNTTGSAGLNVLKAGDTMSGTLNSFTITPVTTATYTLGDSSHYYSNLYATRLYLNATAYLDGGTAGVVGITGLVGIGTGSPTHTLTLPSTSTGIALYNTADQTTNYERVRHFWSTNVYTIAMENGGTGTLRTLQIIANTILTRNTSGNTGALTVNGANSASSGISNATTISPTYTHTGTAGYTALLINPTETTTGSGTKLLADFQVGGVSKVSIKNDGVIFPVQAATASAPTYVKGGVYFNTTTNKLYVGGAVAWEQITSV